MSRCLNRATLIGYLGADPEIRTLPGGGRVAHVALATTRRWNDRDGKPREKTQWHRITVWDSLPSTFAFVEAYVRKGDRVFVEGEIDYHSYEDRDGVVRWSTEIRASEVLAAGELSGGEGKRAASNPSVRAKSGAVQMSRCEVPMTNVSMYPDFSWSHSRDRALMDCARAPTTGATTAATTAGSPTLPRTPSSHTGSSSSPRSR